MDAEVLSFADEWTWLIFVGVGLLMIIIELLVGVDTGLDLAFTGTAFIVGGLITWPFANWAATIILTVLVCVAYVFIGRRYVHRRLAVKLEKTNIDAVIGATGVVLKAITRNDVGRIKVGNEKWRARSEQEIPQGNEVIVTGISGTTLTVEKPKGGND